MADENDDVLSKERFPKGAGGWQPGKVGRPSKLTPETVKMICDTIRAGNYMETAAARAGINKETLYRWLRIAATAKPGGPNQKYREFGDAVAKAMADAEAFHVAIVAKAAASGKWLAAAWWLERARPDRWRERQELDVGVTSVQMHLEGGGLLKKLEKLAQAAGNGPSLHEGAAGDAQAPGQENASQKAAQARPEYSDKLLP